VIKHQRDSNQADILVSRKEIGELQKKGKDAFELVSKDKRRWLIDRKVDGRISPFSVMATLESPAYNGESVESELKIKDHLFRHKGNFYMIGMPEGRSHEELVRGEKYINRLVNFPFSDLNSIDPETFNRLRRQRGIPVGKIFGLGAKGFHAIIEDELEDIGLPLAVLSYLIYSTF
jgi:hypothetical protein